MNLLEGNITQDMSLLLNFLKKSQDVAEGDISLESFLSSLTLSIIFCMCQLSLFVCLRKHFPKFHYPYDNSALKKLKSFDWKLFNPSHYLDINGYKSKIGMDGYLLLRFLYISLYMFVGISIVSITVLLPVNYYYGISKDTVGVNSRVFGTSIRGLDMISTASVSANHTDKGVFHFLVALFVVIRFHHVLVQKFEFSIKLKHENIIKLSINPELCDSLKTVYVDYLRKIQNN